MRLHVSSAESQERKGEGKLSRSGGCKGVDCIVKVDIDYIHVWLSCVDSRVPRGAAEGERDALALLLSAHPIPFSLNCRGE